MEKIIWLALAGGIGTLARYGLGLLVRQWHGGDFPMGTLAVNALGCLLFGLVWSLAEGRLGLHADVRTVVLVGFMGAFTTFSTFMFETSDLIQESKWALAMGNLIAHNGVGIIFLFLGMIGGRAF